VLAADFAALLTLGWATPPLENSPLDLSMVPLALVAFVTALLMAQALWGNNPGKAGRLAVVSVASFAVWGMFLTG
jgi:hypothetical protein